MNHDVRRLASVVLRDRARELRALERAPVLTQFVGTPTPGWARISEGFVVALAEQLEDIAKELVLGKGG